MLETGKLSQQADVEESVVGPGLSIPGTSAQPQPVPRSAVQMERLIGMALLVGVLLSTIIVSLGGIVYVWRHSKSTVHYRVFRGEPSDLRTLAGIEEDVKSFSGRGIIQVGLILLVGLQVVRVVLTGMLFVTSRDWVFTGITTLVLALLMYGLFLESAVGH
jgi:uncharacterized membrane protein